MSINVIYKINLAKTLCSNVVFKLKFFFDFLKYIIHFKYSKCYLLNTKMLPTNTSWLIPVLCYDYGINKVMKFNKEISQWPTLENSSSTWSSCVCLCSIQLLWLLSTVQKYILEVTFKSTLLIDATTHASNCNNPANCPEYNLTKLVDNPECSAKNG